MDIAVHSPHLDRAAFEVGAYSLEEFSLKKALYQGRMIVARAIDA
jgi:hypothetical protein